MNFGVVVGDRMYASVPRKFKPERRISPLHGAASLLGGFLLGYGALLAYGCNVGAFFSGISSGSMRMVFALI